MVSIGISGRVKCFVEASQQFMAAVSASQQARLLISFVLSFVFLFVFVSTFLFVFVFAFYLHVTFGALTPQFQFLNKLCLLNIRVLMSDFNLTPQGISLTFLLL